jgi:hypothetical protein
MMYGIITISYLISQLDLRYCQKNDIEKAEKDKIMDQ